MFLKQDIKSVSPMIWNDSQAVPSLCVPNPDLSSQAAAS